MPISQVPINYMPTSQVLKTLVIFSLVLPVLCLEGAVRYFFILTMVLLCGCNPTGSFQVSGAQKSSESFSNVSADAGGETVLPDEQFDRGADGDTEDAYSEDLDREGADYEESRQRLEDLPDGRYTLISRSRYIADDERLGRQRVVLEKSDGVAAGMLLAFPDGNPCFEGVVEGDRIVDVQTVKLPHTDAGADPPVTSDYAIQVDEYVIELGDNDYPEEIDACQTAFFNLTAPSGLLGDAIAPLSAVFRSKNNGQINMRERPSLGAAVVNTARSGSSAYVSRVQEDFLGNLWYYTEIENSDSAKGWVHSDLIELID